MVGGEGDLRAAVERLAQRTAKSEADVQSDVRLVLLLGRLNLDEDDLAHQPTLEAQVGKGRRIDVELGSTVIEVKKDIRPPAVREKAVEQLGDYVRMRSEETGTRYVGILTDGAVWELYHRAPDQSSMALVSSHDLAGTSADPVSLLEWLEGVLSTAERVPPTPGEVAARLGAESPAHALDFADLLSLYRANSARPTVKMKRELWARLLTTAFGTNFTDDDELFVEHSLLVISAEIIAHAVVGLDPTDAAVEPTDLLGGVLFDKADIGGVVDADFFDWVVEVPDGDRFVRALARRLCRFAWHNVDHDVMKVLYESVIAAEQRKRLGEYYTPDWLAERIVDDVVTAPLEHRVLDPACGSGTFLFHAVRHALAAADAAGFGNAEAIQRVTQLVLGVDIHPVAVTLARVTYLLAIGWQRLQGDRPAFSVPVFLGDSLQWGQEETLFDTEDLVVRTNDGAELFARELRFPRALLDDAGRFDELVAELARRASGTPQGRSDQAITGTFTRFGVAEEHRPTLRRTLAAMTHLFEQGRDHIWGYYVRNLARPAWLSRPENRVDHLVGNPPWLAFRFMTGSMQAEYRSMTRERGLWSSNASVATHQDLSALFVARSVQLYLKDKGSFGFVMPNAVLTRQQYEGFRAGSYECTSEPTRVSFDDAWDLEPIRPIFFPQSSCVVRGRRSEVAGPLPAERVVWSGRLPRSELGWDEAAPHLSTATVVVAAAGTEVSPYAAGFSQGATFVPRVLFVVEPAAVNQLGVGAGQRPVRSRRSSTEKAPWKSLPDLTGSVETQFLRPLYLGESLMPFRVVDPLLAVVPWDGTQVLDEESDQLALYPGLERWWTEAVKIWESNRSGTTKLSLRQQVDYRRKLSGQFPSPRVRVVYTSSGVHLTAAVIRDASAVIDTKLYWSAASSELEGGYLLSILNSASTGALLAPLQNRGKDSPRDIHKYVWRLPIPTFDPSDELHADLAVLGQRAERAVAQADLGGGDFRRQRQRVRDHLRASGLAARIDSLVIRLLGVDDPHGG